MNLKKPGNYKAQAKLDSEAQMSSFLDNFSSCSGKNGNCQLQVCIILRATDSIVKFFLNFPVGALCLVVFLEPLTMASGCSALTTQVL